MLIIRTYCYGTGPGTSTRSVGKVSIASNQKDVTYCNIDKGKKLSEKIISPGFSNLISRAIPALTFKKK